MQDKQNGKVKITANKNFNSCIDNTDLHFTDSEIPKLIKNMFNQGKTHKTKSLKVQEKWQKTLQQWSDTLPINHNQKPPSVNYWSKRNAQFNEARDKQTNLFEETKKEQL